MSYVMPSPQSSMGEQVLSAVIMPQINAAVMTRAAPAQVSVEGAKVSIRDAQSDIEAFDDQFRILHAANQGWPCVRASQLSHVVPIDFRRELPEATNATAFTPTAFDADRAAANLDIQGTLARMHNAGFDVQLATLDAARANFAIGLARSVFDRAKSVISRNNQRILPIGANEPPTEGVEVFTYTSGLTVLVSRAYFFSTREGFGLSTPARRRLAYGQYFFGIDTEKGPRFSETCWTVPEVTTVHLQLM